MYLHAKDTLCLTFGNQLSTSLLSNEITVYHGILLRPFEATWSVLKYNWNGPLHSHHLNQLLNISWVNHTTHSKSSQWRFNIWTHCSHTIKIISENVGHQPYNQIEKPLSLVTFQAEHCFESTKGASGIFFV